jgi:hypothetical protein
MSNVVHGLAIFSLWVITTYLLKYHPQFDVPDLGFILLTFAGFYLVLLLFLEIAATYQPAQGKVSLLIGFIAVAYIILPPIFGGIMENDTIIAYSPAGFLVFISSQEFDYEIMSFAGIWIYNLLLSIIPAVLVGRRYFQLTSYKPAI